MSIYSSWFGLEGKEAPFIYQGSHVLPQSNDRRGGSLDIAAVPDHIERDYAKPGKHDWLRVSLEGKVEDSIDSRFKIVDAVLDRKQVAELRNILTQWLEAEERA